MFGRILWRVLRGNRGRLLVAVAAMACGAAVISALLNMQVDVRQKMTREFRALGANLVVSHSGEGDQALASEKDMTGVIARLAPAGTIQAPYLYVAAKTSAGRQLILAGTWLDAAQQLNATWKIRGSAIQSREDPAHCLAGEHAAREIGIEPGANLELHVGANVLGCTVAGVITAGGDEDNQVFANLGAVQKLAGQQGRIQLVQARVPGTAAEIQAVASGITTQVREFQARPIRQIAESEGKLLGRVQLLMFSMAALIFVLTALSVLATMTALAMERRADVGLMKAIGGSIGRIVGLFLAEVSVLGAAGGIAGYLIGAALTVWIGRSVFGAAISPRLEVLPVIIILMVGVALAGALPLRLLGRVKPAVILRGE